MQGLGKRAYCPRTMYGSLTRVFTTRAVMAKTTGNKKETARDTPRPVGVSGVLPLHDLLLRMSCEGCRLPLI